ncbi:hypothetical protein L1887_01423 [Cichorium endivia]|nr:hypothetical protein L1887_01423 [Cichorium endivia]
MQTTTISQRQRFKTLQTAMATMTQTPISNGRDNDSWWMVVGSIVHCKKFLVGFRISTKGANEEACIPNISPFSLQSPFLSTHKPFQNCNSESNLKSRIPKIGFRVHRFFPINRCF